MSKPRQLSIAPSYDPLPATVHPSQLSVTPSYDPLPVHPSQLITPSHDQTFPAPLNPNTIIQAHQMTLTQSPGPDSPHLVTHGSNAYGQDPFYDYDPFHISLSRFHFETNWHGPPSKVDILNDVNQRPLRLPETTFSVPHDQPPMGGLPPSLDPVLNNNSNLLPPSTGLT